MMNPANAVTMLRILMIPVFAWAYYHGRTTVAFILFLLASATDYLDGYLARKFNAVTSVGKLLDPLADKLMLLTALYFFADAGHIPWWVFIALAVKEGGMVAGSLLMLEKKVVVHSNAFGKASTVLFIVAIVSMFAGHYYAPMLQAGRILIYAALASSIVAMLIYGRNALSMRYAGDEGDEGK